MKLRFLICIFSTIFALTQAYAQNSTGRDINQWATTRLERLDKKLNEKWKILIKAVEERQPNDKYNLIDEQRAWIIFKEAACELLNPNSEQDKTAFLTYTQCQAKILEDRIQDFQLYFDTITDDDLINRLMQLSDSERSTLLLSYNENYNQEDRRLNKIYRIYMDFANEKIHSNDSGIDNDTSYRYSQFASKFKQEQRLWISFIEKSCSLFNDYDFIQIKENCLAQLTKERHQQFLSYKKMLPEPIPNEN